MRNWKALSVMTALLALMAAVSGCGGKSSSGGGDTIKLGGNLEMTGGSASYGISSKNAIELALKQINAKGGVNGKKLSLVVADNKSEATEATNAMQKLISQDRVVGVIGPNLSSAVIASTAVSGSAKTADITPMGTNPKVTVDDAGKVKVSAKACQPKPEGYVEPKKPLRPQKFSRTEHRGNDRHEGEGVERRVFRKKED